MWNGRADDGCDVTDPDELGHVVERTGGRGWYCDFPSLYDSDSVGLTIYHMGGRMTSTKVTVPADELISLTAWVLAYDELFNALERVAPPSVGNEAADEAIAVVRGAFAIAYPAEDDWGEAYEAAVDAAARRPEMVEVEALAHERAAAMLRRAAAGGSCPATLYGQGDAFTPTWLHAGAARLETIGRLIRELGTAEPSSEACRVACVGLVDVEDIPSRQDFALDVARLELRIGNIERQLGLPEPSDG